MKCFLKYFVTITIIKSTRDNSCFCGNLFGSQGKSTNCNSPCPGDLTEICGGSWANSIFATGILELFL